MPSPADPAPAAVPAHADHSRRYHENHFVYPVLSRRSRGISIGINLNPDQRCNFACVYCQVDRSSWHEPAFLELPRLLDELDQTLDLFDSGRLFEEPRFAAIPESLRRLNDLAFSGDGEPTCLANFDEVVAAVAALKRRRGLEAVKLVLITNASLLRRPAVREALNTLDRNQGEIWAKLDAGTPAYFERINRSAVDLDRILRNLEEAAQVRPLVIQSLFLRLDGHGPPPAEIDAYCKCLDRIRKNGGAIDRVQVYTVARGTAESSATPLSPVELDLIAAEVHRQVRVPVETFPGASSP